MSRAWHRTCLGGKHLGRSPRDASGARPGTWRRWGFRYRRTPAQPPLTTVEVKVFQHERRLRTAGGLSVRDITDEVQEAVRESGVRAGIVCVYSPHTTCCVRVNEFEDGFLEDFAGLLRSLVPSDRYYAHDDWGRRTENVCAEDMEL